MISLAEEATIVAMSRALRRAPDLSSDEQRLMAIENDPRCVAALVLLQNDGASFERLERRAVVYEETRRQRGFA